MSPKTVKEYLEPIKAWITANDLELVVLRRDDQGQYAGFRQKAFTEKGELPVAMLATASSRAQAEILIDHTDSLPPHPSDMDYYLCAIFQRFQRQGLSHLYMPSGETHQLDCKSLGAFDQNEFAGLKQARLQRTKALRTRLRRIGTLILIAGFVSAALVYLIAANNGPSGIVGYQVINGKSYPIMQGDSRQYQRDMAYFGGTLNLVASEITQWFTGLWHGRDLAYTLAVLSIGAALLFFLVARLLPEPPSLDKSGNNPEHTINPNSAFIGVSLPQRHEEHEVRIKEV